MLKVAHLRDLFPGLKRAERGSREATDARPETGITPVSDHPSLPFMTAGGPLGTSKVLTCGNVSFVRGINPGWDTQVRKEASSP